MIGQDIDNLAFAFIPPLRTHDDGRLRSAQSTSLWSEITHSIPAGHWLGNEKQGIRGGGAQEILIAGVGNWQ
jgi:hypothetical protein